MKADKLKPDQIQELLDFVVEIATGTHDDLCPLNHLAYRNKWCNCCEAKKLIFRLTEDNPEERLKMGVQFYKPQFDKPITSEYYEQHAICPKCKGDDIYQTTAGYFYEPDENKCNCECGWHGITHDLISKKLENKDGK